MIRPGPALAAALLLASACSAAAPDDTNPQQPSSPPQPMLPAMARMRIVLMSSLPLVHGEGVDMAALMAGHSKPHPLHAEMAAAHDLLVADVLDDRALQGAELLVLVQPRALAPQELMVVDSYVRSGGRLLLFADPMLDWGGGRGLGDPQGALRTSLISPLLNHWRVELVDPGLDRVVVRPTGARLVHPGQFGPLPGKSGDAVCRTGADAYVAHCTPGRGRAVLVADADLLDPATISDSGESRDANRRFVASLITDLFREDTS